MFNDKKNLPENDPLKAQFDGIDKEVRASAELKQAAKTGVPLRTGKREGTAVHVRRFGKAVAAYALGILLFLGVVAVLPGLWESDPIGSPGMNVTTTDEQDDLTIEQEIISAYAKQYGRDEKYLSVRIVAEYDGAYAIVLRDAGVKATIIDAPEVVHFYPFRYYGGNSINVYKDGRFYTLTQAYETDVLNAKNVVDLYLLHAENEGYLDEKNPEKFYTWATIEDDFDADKIIIVIFPEFTLYPYTVEDFAEIGCVELRNLWFDEDDPSEARIISLTLDKNSKQNVLDCIRILEHRADLESAEPSFVIEIED